MNVYSESISTKRKQLLFGCTAIMLLQLVTVDAKATVIVDGFESPVGSNSSWYVAQDWAELSTVPSVLGLLHPGEDWNKSPKGSDIDAAVYAVAHGEVVYTRYLSSSNKSMVVVKHTMPSGENLHSMYLHVDPLSSISAGDVVVKGQKIASIANLPNDLVLGDISHLHFEMRTKPITSYEWPNSEGRAYYSDYSAMLRDGLDFDPSNYIANNHQIDWDIPQGTKLEQTENASPSNVYIGDGGTGTSLAGLTVDNATLNTALMRMGRYSDTYLNITNGAEVNVDIQTAVGYWANTYASIQVSDAGSVFRPGQLDIGGLTCCGYPGGDTSLLVTNGGKIEAKSISLFRGGVVIDGVGTKVDIEEGLYVYDGGSSSDLGFSRGLQVTDGAVVRAGYGGIGSYGVGNVFVSGNSTELRYGGFLGVTDGSVEISDGAMVSAKDAMVGSGAKPSGTGLVRIKNGSTFSLDTLRISHSWNPAVSFGSGTVQVDAGGVLRSSSVIVGRKGTLKGTGKVIGNVTSYGGLVSPGLSPGTLFIDGNFTMLSGQLLFEVAGLTDGMFDVLDVTGTASLLGGEVVFDFIDGFVPSIDDVIQYILTDSELFISDEITYSFRGVPSTYEFLIDTETGSLRVIAGSVPEPSILALMMIGIIGFFWMQGSRSVGQVDAHKTGGML